MLIYGDDKLRSRMLMEIDHPPADEGVFRSPEFRQIERKWDLALEPWLNGMPVSRDYVDKIGTGQCIDMQICKFCERG